MKATVIIPVKSSYQSLLKTLESLSRQATDLIDEVIVVENGSNEIRELSVDHLQVRLLHSPVANRSLARNTGAKHALSPLLIFLDADVVLEDSWVERVAHSFSDSTLAVQTAIIPSAENSSLLLKIRKMRAFIRNQHSFFSINKEKPEKIVINSAAFAIGRETFHALGGFDENLTRHEDLDFTQRLLRREGRIVALKGVKCEVFFQGSLLDYFKRELDCGLHIVRYHEKWSSQNFKDPCLSLGRNVGRWLWSLKDKKLKDSSVLILEMLELTYFMGNFLGILRKLLSPFPGPLVSPEQIKAEREFHE